GVRAEVAVVATGAVATAAVATDAAATGAVAAVSSAKVALSRAWSVLSGATPPIRNTARARLAKLSRGGVVVAPVDAGGRPTAAASASLPSATVAAVPWARNRSLVGGVAAVGSTGVAARKAW